MANPRVQRLYGIGEWYGRLFSGLSPQERRDFAELQVVPRKERPAQTCPFQSTDDMIVPCNKEGGVCSLRAYERDVEGQVQPSGTLATTCPSRFLEDRTIFNWISEVILGHAGASIVLGQVGFLEREDPTLSGDVGRIDNVLVVPGVPLQWCALEIQAVYFQGASMLQDFARIRMLNDDEAYFPAGRRQPDYRSSGPKRLMPQLEIKVPTLRRWGKKMAVVVDRSFFSAMGHMERVRHVSNSDIAWFVVKYEETEGVATLTPDDVYLTTLERSVEGLTAGIPVDLETFEQRILTRVNRLGRSEPIQLLPYE